MKIMEYLNGFEGDSFFDLSTKIDLKNFNQPVLVSSTINLNPLAAVSLILFEKQTSLFIKFYFI